MIRFEGITVLLIFRQQDKPNNSPITFKTAINIPLCLINYALFLTTISKLKTIVDSPIIRRESLSEVTKIHLTFINQPIINLAQQQKRIIVR